MSGTGKGGVLIAPMRSIDRRPTLCQSYKCVEDHQERWLSISRLTSNWNCNFGRTLKAHEILWFHASHCSVGKDPADVKSRGRHERQSWRLVAEVGPSDQG